MAIGAGLALRDALRKLIRSDRPDLLHDHGIWLPANHHVAAAANESFIPRAVQGMGMLEPWAMRQRAYKKRLAWGLYQRSDLETAKVLFATGEGEAESMRRLGLRQPIAILQSF